MSPNELILLSILVGQFMPYFVDVINKYIASAKLRFWVSLLISFTVAVLYNIDQLSVGSVYSWLYSAFILWTSSQAAYKTYYEGSKAQTAIRFSKGLFPLPKF